MEKPFRFAVGEKVRVKGSISKKVFVITHQRRTATSRANFYKLKDYNNMYEEDLEKVCKLNRSQR